VIALHFMVIYLHFMEEMRKNSDRRTGLSTKFQNSYLPNLSQGFKNNRDSNKVSPKYKFIQVSKQLNSKHKVHCQNIRISEYGEKAFLLNKPLGYV